MWKSKSRHHLIGSDLTFTSEVTSTLITEIKNLKSAIFEGPFRYIGPILGSETICCYLVGLTRDKKLETNLQK